MLVVDILRKRNTPLTVEELAPILHVSPRQLYKLAAANRIPNFKIKMSVRFDPEDICEWFEEKLLPASKDSQNASHPQRNGHRVA